MAANVSSSSRRFGFQAATTTISITVSNIIHYYIMSQTSATTRRIIRTLAHRKVDWNADVWKAAPIVPNVSKFRTWVGTADALAEKYSAPPTPIDFTSTKKAVRDKELVDLMEAFYKTASVPAETYEWSKEDKDYKLAHFEQVKEQAQVYAALKDDTMKEIEFLKATLTTENTTVYDLMCNNPTVHEEIEDEIERREWFKDIGLGSAK